MVNAYGLGLPSGVVDTLDALWWLARGRFAPRVGDPDFLDDLDEASEAEAHATLIDAAIADELTIIAFRPSIYNHADAAGIMIAPCGVGERLSREVLVTPGLRIHAHGYITLRYRAADEELPLFVAARYLVAELQRKRSPARVLKCVTHVARGPGRPTAKRFLLAELRARHRRGEIEASLAEETRQLLAWLETAPCWTTLRPTQKAPKHKAAAACLRAAYWKLRAEIPSTKK